MKVIVNGKETELTDSTKTLEDLLRQNEIMAETKGVAVAVNDMVVSKKQWCEYELKPDDKIDIIHAIQGG